MAVIRLFERQPTLPPRGLIARSLLICLLLAVVATTVHADSAPSALSIVAKRVDGFEFGAWRAADGNQSVGAVSVVDESPLTHASAASARSLLIEPSFSGEFAGFGAEPASPLIIPGKMASLGMQIKISDPGYDVKVGFRDGWGRDRVDEKYLQWQIPTRGADNQWKDVKFEIPPAWVQPVQITGISIDNWGAKSIKKQVQLLISQVEVKTDLSNLDPATGILTSWTPDPERNNSAEAAKTAPATPLVQLHMSTSEPGNVFVDAPPHASICVQNWKPSSLNGLFKYRIVDSDKQVLDSGQRPIQAQSMTGFDLPLTAKRFGVNTLEAEIELPDNTTVSRKLSYARVPQQLQLTEQEKLASPYGINYFGGSEPILWAFRRAGIVWFREYAFTYPALMHARGDGSFSGWPNFLGMVRAYQDVGAELLPVLQRSIVRPNLRDGMPVDEMGPSAEWVRNMTSILLAFPQVKYWEASNEYDLPTENSTAEQAVNWLNYEKYHAKLAEIAQLVGSGSITIVENGHPGIFPEVERTCVQSGFFDKIGVVNSHHYTGTEPPELNWQNFNTHSDYLLNRDPALLYDQLRETSRAACSDGKQRQHWLTEFGWDTLAGPVVSPFEQAVFLQRGWMLAMAAGCQKAFWFYNFDSANPKGFFDGCGLFTYDQQPKPALSAMAALTSILPTPKYIGMINAGDNTQGYVFAQNAKFIAALFAIQGQGPTVTLNADRIYDYLGNQITDHSVTLTMAPTYAVGISKVDPFYLQTAYNLDSAYMTGAAAGDSVTSTLEINNNRDAAIQCTIESALPSGWTTQTPLIHAAVGPGERKLIPISFAVSAAEQFGVHIVKFRISEESPIKEIPLKVVVHAPVTLKVAPITGRPGQTRVAMEIDNRSALPRSGTLRLTLPAAWTSDRSNIPVKLLAPAESTRLPIVLTWDDSFKDGEAATAEFIDQGGYHTTEPIIPSQLKMHSASGVKLNGDLSEWPAQTEIPAWVLGSTAGPANARVHLAWSSDGIYVAVKVHDSKVKNNDPTAFWTQDALELFVDTADDKTPRAFDGTDHQFWFVPLVAQHRVYAGRWKVKNEIPATQFDLSSVVGFSQATADGYLMEFLLPSALLNGFHPQAGGAVGMNLNLDVKGREFDREVFWPRSKASGVQLQQHNWGTMKLVQ